MSVAAIFKIRSLFWSILVCKLEVKTLKPGLEGTNEFGEVQDLLGWGGGGHKNGDIRPEKEIDFTF